MKEFFANLISTWWGITIICIVCAAVWIILSALLYRPFFKRFYDLLLSFIAIVVFSPLLLILTLVGAIAMGGNPFFTQKRPGKRGKNGEERIFKLIKFRTMNNKKDESGNLLSDEKRLTRYGKFLRSTSLDELPELFNIFVGDMSIVGPRPLLVRYLPYYTEEERHRHDVRPGLTGLAQVNGRNAISWEEKFRFDLDYVNRITLWRDIKIIFLTAIKVLRRSDISQEGQATMEDFAVYAEKRASGKSEKKRFCDKVMDENNGNTTIYSVGQAGFIIKSKSGQLLGIDLYLSNCVRYVENREDYERLLPVILNPCDLELDVLICTHFHRDHYDIESVPGLMANGKTKLFCARDCRDDVKEEGIDKNRVDFVSPGDTKTCGDFTLHFVNCDHGQGAPLAVGVIVEVDGYKILGVGDSCLRTDRVNEYLEYGNPDVMIAPINGAYGNLNESECAVLANSVKPGITIPCHYGMFEAHGGSSERFSEIMKKEYPENKFVIMKQGDAYTL